MYAYYNIEQLKANAQEATTKLVCALGIIVYVNSNPDDVSPDFVIDPADIEGLKIFREFAAKMAAHYNTLKK